MAILKLYYTGAESSGAIQTIAEQSLGGYFSVSPVPNDVFGNLFSELSQNTLSKDTSEYIGVVLKNETGSDVTDILVAYEYSENNYAKLDLAAVIPAKDDCDKPFMEVIPSRYSKPLMGDFHEANRGKASASIEVKYGSQVGQVVDVFIEGSAIASTVPFTQIVGPEGVVDAIVSAINLATAGYTAEKVVDSSTQTQTNNTYGQNTNQNVVVEKYYVKITKDFYGEDTDLVEFKTAGNNISDPTNLAGGANNQVNIGDLINGDYIGLWFKRSLAQEGRDAGSGKNDSSCSSLAEQYRTGKTKEKSESVSLDIEWT